MNRREQITCKYEAGFTLLELLISIALLGLLSLALFNGLRFGTRAWEIADTHTVDTNRIRIVQIALSDRIGHAYPFFRSDGENPGVQLFGTNTELTFLSAADPTSDRGGLSRVTVRLRDERLELSEMPELAVGRTERTRTLLTDVHALDIAYFGWEEASRWQSQWLKMSRPPALVRIRLSLNDTKAVSWPDLVIAPKIGADVACTYDPRTKYCAGRS